METAFVLFGEEQQEDTAVASRLKRGRSLAALLCKENGHRLPGREYFKKIQPAAQNNPTLAGR